MTEGRWVLLHENAVGDDVPLAAARRMAPVDMLLVEGRRLARIPIIEVFRPSLGKAPLFLDDPGVAGVARDARLETGDAVWLPLNGPGLVAGFILAAALEVV